MRYRPVKLNVHPLFRKAIKSEAAEKDVSIIELTRQKALSDDSKMFKKKRFSFDF